ncbi:hypothetical protein F442_13530 [Phytophthora nicotianae P10297]|uniref:Uncharacterized protein n=2 Tax=Phytophthora nicotianae TaxID=4792 RepID=W2YVB6_PHYNI|nr:hypothetical protein L915_13337 [Phytophthora nicotianae]ETP38953.1 hypothetical protein F442_13530 [Phytophthora nicotianae P10297]
MVVALVTALRAACKCSKSHCLVRVFALLVHARYCTSSLSYAERWCSAEKYRYSMQGMANQYAYECDLFGNEETAGCDSGLPSSDEQRRRDMPQSRPSKIRCQAVTGETDIGTFAPSSSQICKCTARCSLHCRLAF